MALGGRLEQNRSLIGDAELVVRCRGGDQAAWEMLVDRYSTYVHSLVVRGYRLSSADAEDVFQETFTRLYVGLDRLRDGVALQAWLGRTARNLAVDRIRADRRRVLTGNLDETLPETGDRLAQIEQALDVRRALEELGEPCGDVLRRFFLEDQSYATIAEALNAPIGTVASRISRCLTRLAPLVAR